MRQMGCLVAFVLRLHNKVLPMLRFMSPWHRRIIRFSRTLHITSAMFNVAFVYSPLHHWRFGLPVVQMVTMPLLVMTGAYLSYRRCRGQAIFETQRKNGPAGVYPREGGGWGFDRGGCSLKENPQRLAAQALAQREAGSRNPSDN